jgi:superfamily I DNA/RNA helicase
MSLLRRLVPQRGQGFFAIGDPYQSIYSFRGALADISQKLASFWEDVSTISLHTNYRSAQNLLDFSQPLFPEKPHLRAFQKKSGSLISYKCHTGGQEAQWIGTQVKRLIGGTSHLEADQEKTGQLGPGDIAVLVRFKALLPPIKRALQQQGIPFTVPEEAHFWNDVRITRILNTVSRHLGLRTETGAYLPECPADILLQGPSRLVEYYQKDSSFDGLFWESKAFKELQAQYASFGNWKDLLNWIRLEEDMSQIRKKAQKVRLLTIHAAKGLEFEAVFLPALEQGILPFFGTDLFASQKKQVAITTDQEEEKRLFFVGITRAKQFLFLSHASQRTIYGKQYQLSVSSLLSLLPWDMVQHIKSVSRTVKQEKQLRLL